MPSDDQLLAETIAEFERMREASGSAAAPRKVVFREIPPAMSDEQERALAEREAASVRIAREAAVQRHLSSLIRDKGARYAECRLANFHCTTDAQRRAVERLSAYCRGIADHATAGEGVFLFGPCGSGKDHLAMALSRVFILATAQPVTWVSGAMLFERLRDSFDGSKSEGEVMRPYLRASLLWLSDPLPVRGELSQYQAEALYRLVDGRYNAKCPTIVTANIEAGGADAAFGPAIARRLRESTIQVHCNWPAYRGSDV